jgi:DNA repair protein RAD16
MWRRTVVLRKDTFNQAEKDYYEALYTKSQAQFGAFVQTGTVVNNYAHIFDLLIRLRQVGCLPQLITAVLDSIVCKCFQVAFCCA